MTPTKAQAKTLFNELFPYIAETNPRHYEADAVVVGVVVGVVVRVGAAVVVGVGAAVVVVIKIGADIRVVVNANAEKSDVPDCVPCARLPHNY